MRKGNCKRERSRERVDKEEGRVGGEGGSLLLSCCLILLRLKTFLQLTQTPLPHLESCSEKSRSLSFDLTFQVVSFP